MGYRSDFLLSDVTEDELVPAALDCIQKTAKVHSKYWKAAQKLCEKFE
jgi:hypothetical protein